MSGVIRNKIRTLRFLHGEMSQAELGQHAVRQVALLTDESRLAVLTDVRIY